MRNSDVVYLVYNNLELRIFSNSKMAYEMAYAISGECEAYSSPILVLYRLQELVLKHQNWDIKKVRINDNDLTPQVMNCFNSMVINDYNNQATGGIPNGNFPMYYVTYNAGGGGYAPYNR